MGWVAGKAVAQLLVVAAAAATEAVVVAVVDVLPMKTFHSKYPRPLLNYPTHRCCLPLGIASFDESRLPCKPLLFSLASTRGILVKHDT